MRQLEKRGILRKLNAVEKINQLTKKACTAWLESLFSSGFAIQCGYRKNDFRRRTILQSLSKKAFGQDYELKDFLSVRKVKV